MQAARLRFALHERLVEELGGSQQTERLCHGLERKMVRATKRRESQHHRRAYLRSDVFLKEFKEAEDGDAQQKREREEKERATHDTNTSTTSLYIVAR